jgi:hypothetical protein
MKLSNLATEILSRRRENTSEGQRVAVDGMREIIVAIALEKRGLGRFVSERHEYRLAGDRRAVSHGGHFYPSV